MGGYWSQTISFLSVAQPLTRKVGHWYCCVVSPSLHSLSLERPSALPNPFYIIATPLSASFPASGRHHLFPDLPPVKHRHRAGCNTSPFHTQIRTTRERSFDVLCRKITCFMLQIFPERFSHWVLYPSTNARHLNSRYVNSYRTVYLRCVRLVI